FSGRRHLKLSTKSMMFSILSALSRRNAEVIEAEMAHNPSLFRRGAVRGEEGPSASASRPRRGLASRLIGAFIGLCQFGKKWSDMMRGMAQSSRNSVQNRPQNQGERALPPCHLGLHLVLPLGLQRCA